MAEKDKIVNLEDLKYVNDKIGDLKSAVGAIPVACSKNYAANNANITNVTVNADGTSISFDIGSTADNIGVFSTSMFVANKKYLVSFDISSTSQSPMKLATKFGTIAFTGTAHYDFVYEPTSNASNTIYTRGENPLCTVSITNFIVYELINEHKPSVYPTLLEIRENVNTLDTTTETLDERTEDVPALLKGVPFVYPDNVLDTDNIVPNTVLSSGVPTSNDTCFSTNYFIPAYYGDVITYSAIFSNGVYHLSDIKMVVIAMYGADYSYITSSGMWVNNFQINQANCKYIKITVPNDALDYQLAAITINNKPTKASVPEYVAPHYDSKGVSDAVKRTRRVLWLGTSIPTYGYPQLLAQKCGCVMYNKAIGSSMITSGITANITTDNICGINSIYGLFGLTQTVEQKEAMIENWSTIATEIGSTATLTDAIEATALASSYETIVDPYLTGDNAVDLIVINHAYNDNTENAVAPSGEELNPHYLEGAYNWLIKHILEANPNIGIVIFGHYTDLPATKETALQNVADRWNIPYYLLKNDLGWSSVQTINTTKKVDSSGEWETITATDMTVQAMWLGDGVHPLGIATHKIAEVASPVFESWLKMYCD